MASLGLPPLRRLDSDLVPPSILPSLVSVLRHFSPDRMVRHLTPAPLRVQRWPWPERFTSIGSFTGFSATLNERVSPSFVARDAARSRQPSVKPHVAESFLCFVLDGRDDATWMRSFERFPQPCSVLRSWYQTAGSVKGWCTRAMNDLVKVMG